MSFIVQSAFAAQDPTAPLGWINNNSKVRVISQSQLPTLQSIICSDQHCSAILNGTAISLGESIRGYKLTYLTDNTVTLSRGSKKWQLALFADNIRIN